MQIIKQLLTELTDLSGSLSAPLRALVVSLASVWLAWLWLSGARLKPLGFAGIVILLAYLLDWMGRASLPDSPRFGLALMELWIFAPLTVGATASAVMVVLSVKLWVPDTAPLERKEIIGTATAAISAFLTSGFISWAGEKEDSRIAKRIQRIFYSKYQRYKPAQPQLPGVKYFAPTSRGERLVYSNEFAGAEGWGREARHLRARELAKELASGSSDPQP